MNPVYLDHNATTPVRPEVLEAMLPFLRGEHGNPSSVHAAGQRARKAVEAARAQVARLINASDPEEVVFTSCGSESIAAALKGACLRVRERSGGAKRHIVTSAVEHEAARGCLRELAAAGFQVTAVGVDAHGRVAASDVLGALRPETCLVSILHANNEVGAVNPAAEIGALCRERGVLFHTDAVQSAGKIPVDVRGLNADLLSLSGHKLNAPKGVGALYVREGTPMAALIHGHQERNRRGGTENVAGIAGLGAAAELARRELPGHARELARLRGLLEAGVGRVPDAVLSCSSGERLPQTSHFRFAGVDGHHLVVTLDLEGIQASSGPACVGGASSASHVLAAMGVPAEEASGSLRVSLGWGNTEGDVERFLAVLPGAVERLRAVPIR